MFNMYLPAASPCGASQNDLLVSMTAWWRTRVCVRVCCVLLFSSEKLLLLLFLGVVAMLGEGGGEDVKPLREVHRKWLTVWTV